MKTVLNLFKKDTKLIVIMLLATLLTVQLFYNSYKNSEMEDMLRIERNKVAILSDVIKRDSSTYSRLALEYTKSKDLNKFLANENKILADKLKNIQNVTIINVAADTSFFNSKNTVLGDSIYQEVDTTQKPERIKVGYRFKDRMYSVNGWTLTNPPEAKVNVNLNPFSIAVVNNELEDGSYNATVSFYDEHKKQLPFNVTDIKSAVIRKPDRSEKKNIFMFGVGAEITLRQFSPGVILYWNSNLIKVNYLLYNEEIQLNNSEKIEIGYYKLF